MILDKNTLIKILKQDGQVSLDEFEPEVLAQILVAVGQNETVKHHAEKIEQHTKLFKDEVIFRFKNASSKVTTDTILTDAESKNKTHELTIPTEIIGLSTPSVSAPILEEVSQKNEQSPIQNAADTTENPLSITENPLLTTENSTIGINDAYDLTTAIAPEPPETIHIPNLDTPSNSPKSTEDMSIFKRNSPEDAFGKGGFSAQKAAPKPPLNLPNGKQKEPYKAEISWAAWGLTGVENARFEGLEAIGLSYDGEKNAIFGTPIEAGDKEVTLFYQTTRKSILHQEVEKFSRLVRFYVFHDPRSLWTEHESDAPYRKEHTDTLRIAEGEKQLIAASRRGRSHAKDAKFRDDDFALDYNAETGWFTIAVADGAGSAKFSREGSRLATQKALERLTAADRQAIDIAAKFYSANSDNERLFKEELYKIFGEAVRDACNVLENTAKNDGNIFKDYYTTLLLAMCKKYPFGWLVAGFWVGDGGIGLYKHDWAEPRILGKPDSGEYSGQTNFLTPSVWSDGNALWERIHFEIVEDFDLLALMTDGITDAKFHTDANLFKQSKWTELYNDMDGEVKLSEKSEDSDKRLLEWLGFWVKGEYDDRTIALMY
jgi:serine/threonine protein phosphatase PrpC